MDEVARVEPGAGTVSIEVDAVDVVSYALAHNEISVVGAVRVTPDAAAGPDVAVRGAEVRISIVDAQGTLTQPCSLPADLEAGRTTELRRVQLKLDPSVMSQVEEQRPGAVRVEVLDAAGAVIGHHRQGIRVLAANQWLRSPATVTTELLASFVQPNHPAVAALLAEAAEVLRSRTGRASLEGYQAGEQRVDAIVAAIATAARRRGIRYAEPPASWSDQGQKVRTAQEVLEQGVGTCLDTTVVLAAAIEQAGVRPLIFLAEDHCFLGYWRQETALRSIVETDLAPVVNLVDLEAIGLLETTTITRQPDPDVADVAAWEESAYAAARRSPYDSFLRGSLASMLAVVDIHVARANRVLPLPAVTRDPTGAVQVVVYQPAAAAPVEPGTAARATDRARAVSAPVPPRVQRWKNALLDLTLRNRLINAGSRQTVGLAVPGEALGVLEDLISGGRAIRLLPRDRLDDVHRERGLQSGWDLPADQRVELLRARTPEVHCDIDTAAYASRWRALAYKARTIVEETGANNLYLALGSLVWSLDDRPLRSPLILIPIQLAPQNRGGLYQFSLDESGGSVPNFCLLEKLHQLHGIRLPALADPVADGAGIDLAATFRAVRLALNQAGLPYRVEDDAYLSVFQFAKYRLWRDLDENWAEFARNDLVRHLLENPSGEFADPRADGPAADLDELAADCPVPADASQLSAVADALAGRSFVLEGPPGTGKSQTITNLLSQAMRQGRRVLFVAEKRAALDVVRRRLDDVGLGTFALDLHDKSSRPARVREQILTALDAQPQVDADQLRNEAERLSAGRGQLARYARHLHAPNAAGLSLYATRHRQLTLAGPGDPLPVPFHLVAEGSDPALLEGVRRRLRRLPETADLAHPRPVHPWGMVRLTAVDSWEPAAVRGVVGALDHAAEAWQGDVSALGELVDALRTPGEFDLVNRLLAGPAVGLAVLDEVRLVRWRQASSAAIADAEQQASAVPADLAAVVTAAAFELPLAEIADDARRAADSSWFGRRRRLLAVLDRLRPGLAPGAEPAPKEVPDLARRLAELRRAAEGAAARARSLPGLQLPAGWHPLQPDSVAQLRDQVRWLEWAGAVVDPTVPPAQSSAARSSAAGSDLSSSAAVVRRFLAAAGPADHERLEPLAAAVAAVTGGLRADDAAFVDWLEGRPLLAAWRESAPGRELGDPALLGLRRWIAFQTEVAAVASAGLPDAARLLRTGRIEADEAPLALDRGIADASARERLEATGLSGFDPVAHDKTVARFTLGAAHVRQLQTTALPHAVVARRTFDAQHRAGNIGGLRRELAKQRGGLGVRQLLERHADLITAVMPCVLVSPDSLARFFTASAGQFDLVVFDEASQIRVADAVGAMGRATSVVVVGDSKQMPPTSFADSVLDDDAGADELVDIVAVTDEESILTECVQAGVPRTWLSWHYRSQDESLIAFSNTLYYDDRLSTFPAPRGVDAPAGDGVGISLVRVDGHFIRSGAGPGRRLRTNPVEAEAIVAEVRRRFASTERGGVPSLGVVTFNAPQRTLVEELLRDCGDPRIAAALDASDGLFVKNLENVQGDERDVIVFSTAFSTNERGVLPLNFGPLNQAGGERRLNVAVTRARRQVVVFSSFDPDQLRAEQTTARGIKDLRTYLDLAARGTAVLDSLVSRATPSAGGDRHREEVAAALRERGYVVDEQVGLSEFKVDLAIRSPRRPERYAVAVLLDGTAWAARRTVGDRDGLPVEVLTALMHWPGVERVWLPHWLRDPDEVLQTLAYAVERAEDALAEQDAGAAAPAGPRTAAVASTPPASPEPGGIESGRIDSVGIDSGPVEYDPYPSGGADSGAGDEEGTDSSLDDRTGTAWRLLDNDRAEAAGPTHAPPGPESEEDADDRVSRADAPAEVRRAGPADARAGEDRTGIDPLASDAASSPTGPVAPFSGWTAGRRGDRAVLDRLPSPAAAQEVRRVIVEVAAAEGPVQVRRLTRLVAGAFGLTKVSEDRAGAILRLVPTELRDRRGEPFVWPPGVDQTNWTRVRSQTSLVERPIDAIALRELGNAMIHIARAAAGADRPGLLRETLTMFGGTRMTEGIRQRLDEALATALAGGDLRDDGGTIRAADAR